MTRDEMYLARLAGEAADKLPEPRTRREMYLASLCGCYDGELPEPRTREEMLMADMCAGGGAMDDSEAAQTIKGLVDGTITTFTNRDITYIKDYTFSNAPLISINVPNVTEVGTNVFAYCKSLVDVNMPKVTTVGAFMFSECTSLKSIELKSVDKLVSSMFYGCTSLESVAVPNATAISGNNVFRNCSNLAILDFPKLTKIPDYTFYGCTELKVLILRANRLVSVTTRNVFNNTPLITGAGYVYVPFDYIEAYRADVNWATHGVQFRALEDYTVDGTIYGALDESKI